MIKTISGGGKYLTVVGSPGSTYVNSYNGAQGIGNMRYNTSNQNIEIYDGTSWVQLQSGYATVSMTPEAESLLDWARMKRDEEEELKKLAETNPTIKNIVNQMNTDIANYKNKISMIKLLIKEEEKIETN